MTNHSHFAAIVIPLSCEFRNLEKLMDCKGEMFLPEFQQRMRRIGRSDYNGVLMVGNHILMKIMVGTL